MTRTFALLATAAFALLAARFPADAQTLRLVDVVPNSASAEVNRDAEPNIAVNPANPLQIAISAFTPDPGGSANVPLFVSTDGGASWSLSAAMIAGTVAGCFTPVCDITVRFGGSSNVLYASWLNPTGTTQLNVASIVNPFAAAPTVTTLEQRTDPAGYPDQPYVAATTVLGGNGVGSDRLYVAVNDYLSASGKTATIDLTQNAVPPAPAGFSSQVIEARATTGQDGPSVRPAITEDGTAYGVFYGNHATGTDIVVVRDDGFGASATPYDALTSGGSAGVFAATGVPMSGSGFLGSQRVGSQAAIAVDPHDSQKVYVAWGDYSGGSYTLHVRSSQNGGAAWSGDLQTFTAATNPGLAVTYAGVAGLLYQHWVGPSPGKWETHLATSTTGFSAITDTLLASTPDTSPGAGYTGVNTLGDYDSLTAVGKEFYGVFSANNTPDHANFNAALVYPRNANFTTHQVLNLSNAPVQTSVDPFFFAVSPLRPDQDFYVRDWSSSPTVHDQGQEPSTNPVFYANSDIWNRTTNTAGAFSAATDRPDHQDPVASSNFAFVRVFRKGPAAGGGNVNVTARMLFADFGLGVPYADIGSANLTFAPADTVKVLADGSGVPWSVPATHSTHGCLAVEISAPGDPFITDLLGRSPGWPATDLTVLDDNNEAQRNIDLSLVAADSGPTTYYATIQNAASFTRDMRLAWNAPAAVRRRIALQRLATVDERGAVQTVKTPPAGSPAIVLPRMRPTESRTLAITVAPVGASAGADLPISFNEIVGTRAVNGFQLALHVADPKSVLNLYDSRRLATLRRLGDRLGISPAAATAAAQDRAGVLERAIAVLRQAEPKGADPFGLASAIEKVRASAANPQAPAAVAAYASAVNALDAYQTSLRKRAGDPANAVQLLILQRDAFRRSARLKPYARDVAAAVEGALREADASRNPPAALAAFARKTSGVTAAATTALGDAALATDLRAAMQVLNDPDAFAGAYRTYLQRLNELV